MVAHELGMSVARAKKEVGSAEFVSWLAFFQLQWNRTEKQDYYLAQIASSVRSKFAQNPEYWTNERSLIKFRFEDPQPSVDPQTRMEWSKGFWFALTAAAKDRNDRDKRP